MAIILDRDQPEDGLHISRLTKLAYGDRRLLKPWEFSSLIESEAQEWSVGFLHYSGKKRFPITRVRSVLFRSAENDIMVYHDFKNSLETGNNYKYNTPLFSLDDYEIVQESNFNITIRKKRANHHGLVVMSMWHDARQDAYQILCQSEEERLEKEDTEKRRAKLVKHLQLLLEGVLTAEIHWDEGLVVFKNNSNGAIFGVNLSPDDQDEFGF